MNNKGQQMFSLMRDLFPICRSITGNGVRDTFKIIKELIPINMTEVPTGTPVFDWEVPNEWNIQDAYVKDSSGNRVIDFKKSNLHVVSYSIPFQGKLSLEELKKHLHTRPMQPDVIPYVTDYYNEDWGFCLSQNDYDNLAEGTYEVKIDATLAPGSLTYADLVIPGRSKKEILISTYICHPSMANNELSGPVVTTELARHVLSLKGDHPYTYRFVFVPESIGSMTYLSKYLSHLQENVIAGYVVTCIGDSSHFSYVRSRRENTLVDRVTEHVLQADHSQYKTYDFIDCGDDNKNYNAPGIDLPMGSIMRSKYRTYDEYHTSADNLDIISPDKLEEAFNLLVQCLSILENNNTYKLTTIGIPKLGKYGLFPTLSTGIGDQFMKNIINFCKYCDGENDLIWIANKIKAPAVDLLPIVSKLQQNNLITDLTHKT